jgi:hypothetical protein
MLRDFDNINSKFLPRQSCVILGKLHETSNKLMKDAMRSENTVRINTYNNNSNLSSL